jgi:hypothetical protein
MIVELVGAVSPRGQDIESLAYQRTLFPAPAMKKKTINLRERVSAGRQLTFPMEP